MTEVLLEEGARISIHGATRAAKPFFAKGAGDGSVEA